MKGGKGGMGRKKPASKPLAKPKPAHAGPKRGAAKKDWGAIPSDEWDPPRKTRPR